MQRRAMGIDRPRHAPSRLLRALRLLATITATAIGTTRGATQREMIVSQQSEAEIFLLQAPDPEVVPLTGSLTDAITGCAANDILKDELMETSNQGPGEAGF